MSIECYYTTCPKHSNHSGEEDPVCHEVECTSTEHELELYAASRKLQLMGYDLDQLERDNPYNQHLY